MFEIYIVLALGGTPLDPHGGHVYHLNNFESPAPKDDSCQVWLKSDHAFSRRWNSYFLHWVPPPPQLVTPLRGPMGPPWELSWTTFILHLRRYLHTKELDCSTSGSGEEYVWNLLGFGPWRHSLRAPMGPHGGHRYYLNNFESPTPKDDSCQVSLKSDLEFSRRRWKCKKFTDDRQRTMHENGRQ